ncbi:MAG TPA: BMC domain-containing protein [bacterium]|nr:BMC domain-containing protein [bacterium]HNT65267.1 BMC domain-containing protein [bacterium]HOX86930.1 BMC domain-containing protein [bacterium]HPG46261.1 BMC domain-containing protein [bacterium]HPM98545.1 BMC domain-containing protein [bacterium]
MGAAIGLVELSSIAKGVEVADAMVKRAEVAVVVNRTICPGKYMILLNGDVDDVNASIETGLEVGGHQVVDHFIIPNVHRSVFPALTGTGSVPELRALGIIESFSVASTIEAADAAVKAAAVDLLEIHVAMAIGGKAYVTLTGDVAAVQSAVDAGAAVVKRRGLLVDQVVIPSPRREIISQFY